MQEGFLPAENLGHKAAQQGRQPDQQAEIQQQLQDVVCFHAATMRRFMDTAKLKAWQKP